MSRFPSKPWVGERSQDCLCPGLQGGASLQPLLPQAQPAQPPAVPAGGVSWAPAWPVRELFPAQSRCRFFLPPRIPHQLDKVELELVEAQALAPSACQRAGTAQPGAQAPRRDGRENRASKLRPGNRIQRRLPANSGILPKIGAEMREIAVPAHPILLPQPIFPYLHALSTSHDSIPCPTAEIS